METDFIRDHLMYAVIFGFFGFSWFGWAQESPPKSWSLYLGFASAMSLLIALVAGYLAFTHWAGATALTAPGAYEKFGIIVGIELLSSLLGAGILIWLKRPEYVALWIAFVVGVHFIPLALVFQDKALYALAALLATTPLLAIFISNRTSVSAATLSCVGAGSLMVVFAIRGLTLALD